jgi:hypothetical protein
VKCIAYKFDGSNVGDRMDLKMLRFENGDIISNIENYFN